MNRRGFLKLWAATIAAPFVGKFKLITPEKQSGWTIFQIDDKPGAFCDVVNPKMYLTDEMFEDCLSPLRLEFGKAGAKYLDDLIINSEVKIEIREPYETHEIADWDQTYRDYYSDDYNDDDDWE